MNLTEPHLVWETARGGRHPLLDPTTIGRAPGSTVKTEDMGCSSQHAVIRKEKGCWVLQDLGSRNGTWLNGQRIEDLRPLRDGDSVQVGSQTFRLSGLPQERRCPKCGIEPPGKSATCPVCGYTLTLPPPNITTQASRLHPPKFTPLPPQHSQGPITSKRSQSLGGAVALIVIAVAAFLAWRHFDKKPAPPLKRSQQSR